MLAQLNDSLLYLSGSTIGAVMWPLRALLQSGEAANLSVPFQPLVTGLAADPELSTQSAHTFLTVKGPNNKAICCSKTFVTFQGISLSSYQSESIP